MKSIKVKLFLIFIIISISSSAVNVKCFELNTILMKCTFKIKSEESIGTVFILGKKAKDNPKKLLYVMVTAAHILENIKGEEAQIFLRMKNSEGKIEKVLHKIKIREKDKPLWVKHPNADVAAMYLPLPGKCANEVPLLSEDILANNKILEKYEIHPGDELLCLGYPLNFESNKMGFPILRSGKIASYPLTPMKEVKTFLFDAEIFKGNSGGPVYFVDSGRIYDGAMHTNKIQFVIGLVSQEKLDIKTTSSPYNIEIKAERLSLAVIVPSVYIRETIDMLP